MSMNSTIIIATVCFCIFFLGVNAQFDHTLRNAAPLSLVAAANNPQNGISTFSASANDQVVGASCRCNVHTVSNVRINNGPFNSGSYFEVSLSHNANATLDYYFGPADLAFDILEVFNNGAPASTFGSIGICNPSATPCIFDYYCDIYPAVSSLQLVVCSDPNDDTLADSINFYTVGVTEYVANIQTIGQTRSLTQSSNVVNTYTTSNPGPSNFVHYYHQLQPTVAEAGQSSRLFVEAVNWAGATGSAYICVSFDNMVANTDSLSGVIFPGGDINGVNIIPNSVFTNDPSGCTTYCQQGNVNGASSVVVASFDACLDGCGFPENIWIGVRTPSSSVGSTFTVRLRFRDFSVPDLISISSFVTEVDADITDNCDGNQGDFSCENYYEVTNRPTVTAGQPGPYLAVEVYAVHDGSVAAYLSDGFLAGTESLCPGCPIFSSCSEVSATANVPDCWLVVQPCQWPTSRDWILTVEGLNQDDNNEAIEYGVRFNAGTWPLTAVAADEWLSGSPSFGEVLPHHYHHYQVTFTDADLFDDSYFEVELYTFHEEDEIGFAWKFGSFADSGTCYGYDGLCTTATDCVNGGITEDNTGFCRFSFLPCPYVIDYDNIIGRDDGSKVAQLTAGSYYFAVWGLGDSDRYDTNVHYTITWNLRRSLPLFDAVTVPGKVYLYDYTHQYYVTYPADPTIRQITITLSEVTNGVLVLYARCGALAGDCPCWTYDDGCQTGGSDTDFECSVTLSACACPSRTFYFSVQDVFNDAFNGQGTPGTGFYNHLLPASFTLTANIEHYPISEITPIEVSRAQVTVTGLLSDDVDDVFPGSPRDADFYWISTTNVHPANDALVVRLSGLVTNPSQDNDNGIIRVTVAKGGIAYGGSCAASTSCSVPVNEFYSTGQLGVCDLVFQPCYAPTKCVEEDCTLTENFISLAWDYSATFYVTVTLEDTASAVEYTLQLQVVDQAPLGLTDAQPFYGYVGQDQYVHFAYTLPQGKSQNARLYVNLYQNWDKDEGLSLYVHHGGSNAQLAGNAYECLQHDFCSVCDLNGAPDDFCTYQVSPCLLSEQTGTYYISVRGDDANSLQFAGQERAEFTLTVAVYEPVELLESNAVGIPLAESIYDGQEFYYSVTVPTLVTGNIVGRILTIEVGSVIDGSLFFGISQLEPVDDCGCDRGTELVALDSNEWRRYPCELRSGAVYYITVSGDQNQNCDPVGYVVHARIYNVIQETITLANVDTTIVGSYDTTTYQIGYNEWKTLKFTTNAVAGAVLNVDITQPNINSLIPKPIEARLSIGDIATRLGYNGRADVGPSPNDATCVANYVCTGELRTTCSIYVPNCALPQGTTTWFLTFTGEDLTVASISDPINVSIRLINPIAVVTFPALTDYTTTSTSATVSTTVGTINGSYGKSHFTSVSNAATGINAGDSIVISYSGNTQVDFYVSYGAETGSGCVADCLVENSSNPSCTFAACGNIASATWYIGLESFASTTGTFSVRRIASPTNTITVTALTQLNTVTNFAALGTNQWRYHSINVPASSTSHYEVQITGGASFNDVVYVGSANNNAVWLPGLIFDPQNELNEFTLTSGGDVIPGGTCGGVNIVGIADTCCYSQDTSVFAVVGDVGAYNIEIVKVEFADGNPQQINLPSTTTRTTTGGKVAWFSFNLPAGNNIWFELAVSAGQARLYLNKGALAGSDASSFLTDFGACWDNDDLIQQICPNFITAGSFCDGFIDSDCYSCLGENSGSTYYFAVIPDVDATYSLTVISQTRATTLTTAANNNLLFPSTGTQNIRIVDDTLDSTDFSVYSHFVWNFASSPYSIAQYIPVVDDPEVIDRFTYPYIQFVISNVVQAGTQNSADNLVDFFINSGSLAGNSDCYSGRDITQGGSVVPCIENANGAAAVDAITGDITCSVLICDLSCPEQVYFSVGRAVQDISAVSFAIGISQQFAQVQDEIDIVPVTLSTNGGTINYSNAQSLNEVVYFRVTGPSIANFLETQTQFFDFTFNNIIGQDTVLDVRAYNGNECTNFGSATDLCGSLSVGETCHINFDPCASTGVFVEADTNRDFFIRVSRVSGSAVTWGFTLVQKTTTATPIDATATRFTLTNALGASYFANKEIFNGQWHFYEFNVNVENWGGVNQLTATIENLLCNNEVFNLEAYVSWFEDASGVIDVARSNRWPTRTCFVDSDIDPSSFSINTMCNAYGGIYRIAIFADYGLQNYPDPILGVTYPVVYDLSFDFSPAVSISKVALNCDVSVVGGGYYQVRPDASNRGSRLEFALTSVNGDDARLYISKNANPFETDANCAWGTSSGSISAPFSTINGDYYCDLTGSSCNIMVPVCEFDDDTWFIYVDAVPGSRFILNIWEGRVYTPVINLSNLQSYITGGVVDSVHYQYYNFIVDNSLANSRFTTVIRSVGCSGCSVTGFLLEGPHGFASGTGANGAHSQACGECDYGDCDCNNRFCSTTSGYCTLHALGCLVSDNSVFIGIRADAGGSLCPYELEAWTAVDPESIVENVEICTAVYCEDYYHLQSSGGVTDFTESTVTLFITNYDLVTDVGVYVNYGGIASVDCSDAVYVCAAGNDCEYTLACITGAVYVTVESPECIRGATCSGVRYSLYYTFDDLTIQSVAVGGTISSSLAFINAQGSFFTSETVTFSTDAQSTCDSSCGVAFPPGQYYFVNSAGVSLSSFNNIALSGTSSSVSFAGSFYKTFTITVPTGVDSFDIILEDFNYPVDGLDIAYTISTVNPALDGCTPCDAGSQYLGSAGCNNDAETLSVSCVEQTTYYLSLTDCSLTECDISFRIRVEFGTPRTLISGDHNTAYTTVTIPSSCDAGTQFRYYTNVDGPFFVHLKQVGPEGNSATATIRSASECQDSSCTAVATTNGADANCYVQDGCSTFSCAEGLYYVDVDVSAGIDGAGFQLQVINQWVTLSGSASNTISGSQKHFYQVPNTNAALTFKLTVHAGPALRFIVFDGCGQNDGWAFSETKVAAYGDVYTWVPSFAKHSGASTYYVELFADFDATTADEWLRNDNSRADTPTSYTLSVVTGGANCAAPPSTGFCADPSAAGVNVWSSISTSNVWKFVDTSLKDQEAQCLYNDLSDRCVYPTDECRYWLKVFSCLETFPQCDSNGFQAPLCIDVCQKVETACGEFSIDYPFQCCRDRYVPSGSGSTCFNIPPPPPPPPAFDDQDISGESSFPPPIDVPVFPTIYATMPPASNFYTFSVVGKDAEVERQVANSASSVSVCVLLVLSVIALLI